MNFASYNIGIFDSGIGGISVLKKTIELLDNETFVYFGDSKNSPYGSKGKEEIINLCINICNFLIFENNCKAIVVACNTASSAAINNLRQVFEPRIPIVGIEPAIKPAINFTSQTRGRGYILLLATPFTIKGEKLKGLINRYGYNSIKLVALDKLAHMIEHNYSMGDIHSYLYSNLKRYVGITDAVVLGCTHYYFVREIIKNILGNVIAIFDGIEGTSRELRRRLVENNLINKQNINKSKRVYIYNSLNYDQVLNSYRILREV